MPKSFDPDDPDRSFRPVDLSSITALTVNELREALSVTGVRCDVKSYSRRVEGVPNTNARFAVTNHQTTDVE